MILDNDNDVIVHVVIMTMCIDLKKNKLNLQKIVLSKLTYRIGVVKLRLFNMQSVAL